MKINRKFFSLIGLGLVVTGLAITFFGFALSGFSARSYIRDERRWYQTFEFNGHGFGIYVDD